MTRLIVLIVLTFINIEYSYAQNQTKLSGITLVAPRDSFSNNPMIELKQINCQWIAVVPYSFTPANESRVYFGNNHQWWGETPRGSRQTIKLAKKEGIKVMLKPQLWMHNSWVGALDFESESEWLQWESDYKEYILTFAKIAEDEQVDLLCIGTEFKISVQKRTHFWIKLISEIREVYSGLITYCSNWDDFENIPIWNDVDVIGISAYFPLSDSATPSVEDLKKQWLPIKKRIRKLSEQTGKKILFTEYGYLSIDGCAGKTWELEKSRTSIPSNELAQSNALEALYESFCDEDYWIGGFLWKWYPHKIREKFGKHDYTPQGKMSESTISKWFKEINSQYWSF